MASALVKVFSFAKNFLKVLKSDDALRFDKSIDQSESACISTREFLREKCALLSPVTDHYNATLLVY